MEILRINPERLFADFEALCRFGATPENGLNRPALSAAHLEARHWLRQRCLESGLHVQIDGAGNHLARLNCGPAGAPSLLLGSHLDSVPDGGRYDGALGVLAGLEALRTIGEAGLRLPVNLEVVDFTDEEGTLVGFLGSYAFTGRLSLESLLDPRGSRQALQAGLQRAGLTDQGILAARRDPNTLAGYLELHIEQGKQLERHGIQVGVVTSIAGIKHFRLVYHGRAEHAGTAEMDERLDAAQAASAFTLATRQLVLEQFPGCFANVGQVSFEPGAFNIVPGKAILSCEFRAPDQVQFEALEKVIFERAQAEGARFGLRSEIEILGERLPVPTHPLARQAIQQAASVLGLSSMEIASRAGHDAQQLGEVCPAGMIFIPSQGGISHSPAEFSTWQDCVNGANVLLHAALGLAGRSATGSIERRTEITNGGE